MHASLLTASRAVQTIRAMSSQQFYLHGETASSAKSITLDETASLDQVKHIVAAHFAIVEPNGQIMRMSFFLIL